jgi:5-formyltetrahydrofolate cyclo-ligase
MNAPELALHHFAFPRITDRFQRELDFSIPAHPTDWIIGQYGIMEPIPDLPAVEPAALDFIVVPAVIFGVRGERIGRGGGFYDRYLPQAAGAVRIGFGFDFQLVGEPLPQADWDAKMDVVVTDLRIIETSARQT